MSVEVGVLVVAVGVLIGCLSAMFGVGGGIVMVPFMVLALDESQHLAEGTSLMVIVPTAIAGVLTHRRRGYVSFRYGALLAAGGIAGAWGGAILALRLSGPDLQSVFYVFVAVVGVRTVVQGLRQMAKRPAVEGDGTDPTMRSDG
jgi:uncharacterized membrane protein YfcA